MYPSNYFSIYTDVNEIVSVKLFPMENCSRHISTSPGLNRTHDFICKASVPATSPYYLTSNCLNTKINKLHYVLINEKVLTKSTKACSNEF